MVDVSVRGGTNFQKWVTNLWTDFLTISLECQHFRAHLGTKKNPPQSSPPHLCRIRGVSEAGVSQYHSRVRGWGTPALDQTACAKSCQQWEGAKLGWVVSFVSRQMAAVSKETLAGNRVATTLFLCGSLRVCWFKSGVYTGDSLWKVRGPQKYHKIPPPPNSATAQHQFLYTSSAERCCPFLKIQHQWCIKICSLRTLNFIHHWR